jgi:predicted ribosome quality control (RQC) complex YloA/Tae2 family protein
LPPEIRRSALDSIVLHRLIDEVAPSVEGARILEARSTGKRHLTLDIAAPDGLRLVMVAAKALSTLFVAHPDHIDDSAGQERRDRGPGRARTAARVLERGIRGAEVVLLSQGGWERRAELRFSRTERTGLKAEGSIVIDVGRQPCLLRMDGPGAPRAAAFGTPPTELTGDEIRGWFDAEDGVPVGAFLRAVDDNVAGSPSKTVLDIMDVLTDRTADAGEPGGARTVRMEIVDDLARAVRDVASGGGPLVSPTVLWRTDASGRLRVRLSPVSVRPMAGASRSFDSFNEAALFMFTQFWRPLELERRRRVVAKVLTRDLRRKARAVARVRSEITDAQSADEWRREAELLLTRKADVAKGRSVVTVLDLDNRTPVEITLDPALTPVQNAEALFRRARKAARKLERARARLAELESEMDRLTSRGDDVARASEDELTRIESDVLPPPVPSGRQDDAMRGARFRTYVVSGGWEVLVGKSSRDNDVLTHRVARPSDLWFHARQAAGSHVILRRSGRRDEPTRDAILEAAAIAAYHSKAGKSGSVAVCYTEKRHVRRPRGARSGLAIVTREKVVLVEPGLPPR